jgi:hypothetical protein
MNGRWRAHLLAFVGYLAGALALTAAAWASPTTRWVGSCCDQEITIWYLGWLPYALTHGLDPLFTTMLNSPAGVNLMWNTPTPFLSALAWLPSAIGGPIFAYNVVLLGSIVASALAARAAVARYTDGWIGPLVGGAIYGFSPYVASHAALHLNLTSAWVPPLFLIVLDQLLIRRRGSPWRLGIGLGVLAAIQLLISEEILATSVIAAGVLVVVLALNHRTAVRDGLRRLVPALATATISFLALAGWPLAVQFFGRQRITEQVQSPEKFSTDLLNLVLPTPFQLLAPDAVTRLSSGFSDLYHEATGYLGVGLLLLIAVVAIRRWSDPRIRIALITGAILLLLSLGPWLVVGTVDSGIPLPWLPFASLPILEHILPGRFTLFTWLAVALIVGVVVGDAVRLPRPAKAPRLAAVAAALLLIVPAPLVSLSTEVPAFFRTWPAQGISADETVVIAPWFYGGAMAHPMVWAAFAGNAVRMPEAYAYLPGENGETRSNAIPTGLSRTMLRIQTEGVSLVVRGELRDQIAGDLRVLQVRHVIVGPMPE